MELEEYKLVKNNIQLIQVELDALECRKLDGKSRAINLSLTRELGAYEINKQEVFLKAKVDFDDDAPFYINISYKGVCKNVGEIEEEKFKDYVYDQIVPLLLPYAREAIANILSRMDLPIFYLPTIDILNTISANKE